MKVTVWLLFHIFLGTQSVNQKSINLDLQATVLFEPEDSESPFIDKIRSFLNKVQKSISFQKQPHGAELGVLSSFLLQVSGVIITYEERQIKELSKTVSIIVENPLINKNVRVFVKQSLQKWTKQKSIYIESVIKKYSSDSEVKHFLNKLDTFYDKNDKVKLDRIIQQLKVKKHNIGQIFRNIFKICLFDKYISLSYRRKKEFENLMNKLQNCIMSLKTFRHDKDELGNIVRKKADEGTKLNSEENEMTFDNDVIIKVSEAMKNNSEEFNVKK